MVHKYLSVLLLCSVPLIGMEREWNEDIANHFRNELKHVDEMEKENDAILERYEKRTGEDQSSERAILAAEAGRLREELFKELQERAKEEQPAPSQVSPCLDTFEDYLKQPDTTLASNAVRDCIRKYVEFCRSNK